MLIKSALRDLAFLCHGAFYQLKSALLSQEGAFRISLFLEVLVGPFQSFFQGYFRDPVKVFHCLFVGKGGSVDVPFSGRAVGWGNFFSGNTGKDGNQFVQADFCLGAEVIAGVGVFWWSVPAGCPGQCRRRRRSLWSAYRFRRW